MKSISPYDEALQFIKQHPGTGGASSLAKLVLSLYNHICSYSFAECVGNLDGHLTDLAVRMVRDYAARGETDDLRTAGKIIADDLYPGLWQMSLAMNEARAATRAKWDAEERIAERDALEAAEAALFTDPAKLVPPGKAKELLNQEGSLYGYYYAADDWRDTELPRDTVHAAIDQLGGAELSSNCPEGQRVAVRIGKRVYYVSTDYDAREAYLESIQGSRKPIPRTISVPPRGTE
jgi:hypothetical protein